MLKLLFLTPDRKTITFVIDGAKVTIYNEQYRAMGGFTIYPKDPKLIVKMIASRKPTLKVMAAIMMDLNKGENLNEYNENKHSEEKLGEIMRKAMKEKGMMEAKFDEK